MSDTSVSSDTSESAVDQLVAAASLPDLGQLIKKAISEGQIEPAPHYN